MIIMVVVVDKREGFVAFFRDSVAALQILLAFVVLVGGILLVLLLIDTFITIWLRDLLIVGI